MSETYAGLVCGNAPSKGPPVDRSSGEKWRGVPNDDFFLNDRPRSKRGQWPAVLAFVAIRIRRVLVNRNVGRIVMSSIGRKDGYFVREYRSKRNSRN